MKKNPIFSPPPLGTVLWLPGLPGAGSKIYDRSPYGNHGTITGATGVRLPSGLWTQSFDGSDDRVNCGTGASLNVGTTMTLLMWVKITTLAPVAGAAFLVSTQNSSTVANHSYGCYIISNGLRFFRGDGATANNAIANPVPPTAKWILLGMVDDNTNLYLYIKGAGLDHVNSTAKTIVAKAKDQALIFGGEATGAPSYPFAGSMGLYALTTVPYTASHVDNWYQQTKHLFGV